ncbi:hypothetical protein WA556_004210, partial [Blastocystis sp. ATCC 50177/Nand II]
YVKNVEKDVFSGFFEACEDDYVEANAPFVFENDKEKKNIHVVTRQGLHAKAVCFKNLPNLERIYIGDNALMHCEKAIFENLPKLKEIIIGMNAFAFSGENNTELVMKDLPQLQVIRITNHTPDSTENNGMLLSEGSTDGLVAFMSVRKVTLSNLPNCRFENLPHAFEITKVFERSG